MTEWPWAFRQGYDAGVEFHMGNLSRSDNPYIWEEDPDLYDLWQDGFDEAGWDS